MAVIKQTFFNTKFAVMISIVKIEKNCQLQNLNENLKFIK